MLEIPRVIRVNLRCINILCTTKYVEFCDPFLPKYAGVIHDIRYHQIAVTLLSIQCFPALQLDLCINRRDNSDADPLVFGPLSQRLDVVVEEQVGNYHLQLVGDEEAARTAYH